MVIASEASVLPKWPCLDGSGPWALVSVEAQRELELSIVVRSFFYLLLYVVDAFAFRPRIGTSKDAL